MATSSASRGARRQTDVAGGTSMRFIVAALALLGLGAGCAPLWHRDSPYATTYGDIDVIRSGLEAYERAHGALPDSLIAICPSLKGEDCHWLPFGYRFNDGWQRPIRYRRLGSDFELRSAGSDGRFNSHDDVVFRRSLDDTLRERAIGCYRFATRPFELSGFGRTRRAERLA
jgi:hypothetical protein